MTLLKGLFIAVAAFGGFVALMYAVQRSLLYHPERLRTAPAAAGLANAEEVVLATSDGEKVIVWHVPPKPGRPLLLYFHGNAGALAYRAERFIALTQDGNGLVALRRGGCAGEPSSGRRLGVGVAVYFDRRYRGLDLLVSTGSPAAQGYVLFRPVDRQGHHSDPDPARRA
jgi:hypothetical protein